MSPGRELDALIAEKVMGWKRGTARVENYAAPSEEIAHREATGWIDPSGAFHEIVWGTGLCPGLPAYSTAIAAAWEVVEKLRDRFCIEVRTLPHVGYNVDVSAWDHAVDPRLDSAVMRGSLPHAICLAALAACDQKQEHKPRHD